MPARERGECDHPGQHVAQVQCPECGKFVSHGWGTGVQYTQDGWNQYWGGTCATHGEFSEAAA